MIVDTTFPGDVSNRPAGLLDDMDRPITALRIEHSSLSRHDSSLQSMSPQEVRASDTRNCCTAHRG